MKLFNLFAVLAIAFPLQSFAANFCRVDMVAQTTEIVVFAVCDGSLVAQEGAGRNNLGFGLFSRIMSDVMNANPGMRVVNCEGTSLTTCFLSK